MSTKLNQINQQIEQIRVQKQIYADTLLKQNRAAHEEIGGTMAKGYTPRLTKTQLLDIEEKFNYLIADLKESARQQQIADDAETIPAKIQELKTIEARLSEIPPERDRLEARRQRLQGEIRNLQIQTGGGHGQPVSYRLQTPAMDTAGGGASMVPQNIMEY